MKDRIVGGVLDYIKKNKSLTIEEEEKMLYGLESIYLMITKMIIIFALALFLGIFKEMLIYLLIFNIIRFTAFGIHATKSWICLIVSSLLFLGVPFICKIIVMPIYLKIILGIFSTLLILKNSPADTINRPIINKKKRRIYKTISTIISITFTILSLYTSNFLSNALLFSLLQEVIFISPITYKVFKLPYNNYINYLKEIERNDENVFS